MHLNYIFIILDVFKFVRRAALPHDWGLKLTPLTPPRKLLRLGQLDGVHGRARELGWRLIVCLFVWRLSGFGRDDMIGSRLTSKTALGGTVYAYPGR